MRLHQAQERPTLAHSFARVSCLTPEQRISTGARRDAALGELAGAYTDMEAMQATLQDSAIYVR